MAEHDDQLAAVVENARIVVATDGRDYVRALDLADGVLSLHDSLSKGGPFPGAWEDSLRRVVKAELEGGEAMQMVQDSALLLVWVLQNYASNGELVISAAELAVGAETVVDRKFNHYTGEVTFRLVDTKPTLTLIKES